MKPVEGRKRVVIEEVQPQVDCGRYPAKRIVGDRVQITAAVFADGHDHVSGRLLYRHGSEGEWSFAPLTALDNDLWTASFVVTELGDWSYTLEAWIDHFDTWCADLRKRLAAQSGADQQALTHESETQDIPLALRSGALLLQHAAQRAKDADRELLAQAAAALEESAERKSDHYEYPITEEVARVAALYPDHTLTTRYKQELHLWVDRERARFSSWYELFPRSASPDAARHGTFADVVTLLPEIAAMGFDVLYLPPIHPIGTAYRKGRNNNVTATADDPAALGRSAQRRVGTKRFSPNLGHCAISKRS